MLDLATREAAVIAMIEERQEQLVALLQALIRIPSESDARNGDERACQQLVMARMRASGLSIDSFTAAEVPGFAAHPARLEWRQRYRGRPTVVGKWTGMGQAPSLMLMAHIDTVAADVFSAWTHDPWGGDIADGRVFGRGACDDKSGTAAMLCALEALRATGFQPAGDLYLASTIHEENGYGNGMILLTERGYRPASVLYLDGCNHDIEISHCGAGDIFLTVTPHPGAQAALWQVDRAMQAITARLLAERAQVIDRHPLYTGGYILDRGFSCLPMPEKMHNRACVTRELRYNLKIHSLLGETADAIKAWVEHELRAGLAAFAVELSFIYPNTWFEPSHTAPDTAVVRALRQAFIATHGREPRITAGSKIDAYILRNYHHIPVACFGPATLGGKWGAHSPDESIAISDLVALTKVAALSVLRWEEAQ